MRGVGPHLVALLRLGLADPGLAPGVGDAARVADQVDDPQVEALDPAQGEELGGRLAGVDDDLGPGDVRDRAVEAVVGVEVLVELAAVRRAREAGGQAGHEPLPDDARLQVRHPLGHRAPAAERAVAHCLPEGAGGERLTASAALVLGGDAGEDRVQLTGVDRAGDGAEHAFEQRAARPAHPYDVEDLHPRPPGSMVAS